MYAVVAWLVVQLADATFEPLGIPEGAHRVLIILAALGFPVALVLGWIFDWTSEGLVRTPDDPEHEVARLRTSRRIDYAIIGVLVLALGMALFGPEMDTPGEHPDPIRSLAVLPLEDPSNDPEQAYFAFGLTEALIAELAKLEDLRVISRSSITPYENTAKTIPTIARELGVQAVIEGSVMRVGDRVRITAQLIDARTDTHLWAESYERDLADVLALQAEVVAEIAREIHLEVSPAAVGASPPRPIRAEAHEAYLKGVYFQWKRTRAATLKAVSYFHQAIALDPTSPLGHAGLAGEYSCSPTHSWGIPVSELWPSVPREMMARAREHASKALALDPGSPEGHHAIALVRTYGDWDWPGAEASFKRTLEISPGWFWPQATYGIFLSHMQRFDEALHQLETARALDPLSVDILMWLGSLHLWRGERDQAMARWREAKEIDPVYSPLLQSVLTSLCGTDQHDQAIAEVERGAQRFPNDPIVMGELAYCHAVAGDEATARGLLGDMHALAGVMYVSPVSRALVHVGLGDTDAAFEALDQGFGDRDSQLLMLGLDPTWEPLRGDPRYVELMERIGLPRG
jgi:TolB-like protein/Tfp pilus assembly protein PilF